MSEVKPRRASVGVSKEDAKLNRNWFEVGRLLGMGSYSQVYLATKWCDGSKYAMKEYSIEEVTRTRKFQYVLNEKNVLNSLDHPNIIKLHHTFKDRTTAYLVYELAECELWHKIKARGKLPEDLARFYAAEIVKALEYLHSKSIWHRDLKPENILVSKEGHLKLADFGTSKILKGMQRRAPSANKPTPSAGPLVTQSAPLLPAHAENGRNEPPAISLPPPRHGNVTPPISPGSSVLSPVASTGNSSQSCSPTPLSVVSPPNNASPPPISSPSAMPPVFKPPSTSPVSHNSPGATSPSSPTRPKSSSINYLSDQEDQRRRELYAKRRHQSFVGTAEYMAPEVIRNQPTKGLASDLWSLGCIIFQMLVGRPPFQGPTPYLIFEQVVKGGWVFPEDASAIVSPAAKDIICKLIVMDPAARLGAGEGGYARLRAHPFFNGVDWVNTQPPVSAFDDRDQKFVNLQQQEAESEIKKKAVGGEDKEEMKGKEEKEKEKEKENREGKDEGTKAASACAAGSASPEKEEKQKEPQEFLSAVSVQDKERQRRSIREGDPLELQAAIDADLSASPDE